MLYIKIKLKKLLYLLGNFPNKNRANIILIIMKDHYNLTNVIAHSCYV